MSIFLSLFSLGKSGGTEASQVGKKYQKWNSFKGLETKCKNQGPVECMKMIFLLEFILLYVFLQALLVPHNLNFQVAIVHTSFVWTECTLSHVFGPSVTCNLIMHVFDNLSRENHSVIVVAGSSWPSELLLIIN